LFLSFRIRKKFQITRAVALGTGFRPIVGAHQRSATEVEFLLQLKLM